jgi:hypothetical protein
MYVYLAKGIHFCGAFSAAVDRDFLNHPGSIQYLQPMKPLIGSTFTLSEAV